MILSSVGARIAAVFVGFMIASSIGFAQELANNNVIDCSPPDPAPENSCLYTLPPNIFLNGDSRVTVTGTDGRNLTGDWELLGPNDRTIGATLVLIDRTPGQGSKRTPVFESVERDLILQVVEALRPGELVSVYSFDTGDNGLGGRQGGFEKLSGFSTDRSKAISAIENLQIGGTQTLIESSLRDAITVFDAQNSVSAKTILLVSDGFDESSTDIGPVIELAKQKNITISTMTNLWEPAGHVRNGAGIGLMGRLARTTGGWSSVIEMVPYNASSIAEALEETVAAITSSHASIGYIALKEGAVPRDATITLYASTPELGDDTQTTQVSYSSTFSAATPSPPTLAETPAADTEKAEANVEKTRLQHFVQMLSDYWYVLAAIVFLILLALLFLLLKRSGAVREGNIEFIPPENLAPPKAEASPPQEPKTQRAKRQVTGHLLDMATGKRLPLYKGTNGLGRGSKNTIHIQHDSVSRVHAELKYLNAGQFLLKDLKSLNGTFVNNKKITEAVTIQDGGEFSLGTAKFRLMT